MTVPPSPSAVPRPAAATSPLDLDLDLARASRSWAALDVRIDLDDVPPAIRLTGELDQDGELLVAQAVESIAATARLQERIVLDLSGVTFCDVAGLRLLETCASTLGARGKQVVVRHPSPVVTKLVTLAPSTFRPR